MDGFCPHIYEVDQKRSKETNVIFISEGSGVLCRYVMETDFKIPELNLLGLMRRSPWPNQALRGSYVPLKP